MSDLIRALDLSVYSGPTSAKWMRDRYAEGWRLAVIGSWHGNSTNPYVRDQMGYARTAGMKIATYIALSSWHSGDEQVQEARYAIGDYWPELEFVALDMELPGLLAIDLVDALREVGSSPRPIIYSGYWWWTPWARDHISSLWRDIPAWVAYYDGLAQMSSSTPTGIHMNALRPLTGLGPIIGKQYAGTTIIDGVAVDLNVFDASFLKEDDMDEARLTEIERAILAEREKQDIRADTEAFIASFGKPDAEHDAAFRRLYERHIQWRVAGKTWR